MVSENIILGFFTNYVIMSFLVAWILSVLIKAYLRSMTGEKKFNIAEGIETGGMPSSHSAVVAAITTSIYLKTGYSEVFAVALVFSLIIISDAFGVRRNVGLQGDELNNLLKKSKMKTLKIVYGHTITQVIAGLILGIAIAFLFYPLFL